MRLKIIIVLAISLYGIAGVAQEKKKITATDGFEHYIIHQIHNGKRIEGVLDCNGDTIIPLSREYNIIHYIPTCGYYRPAYFRVEKYGKNIWKDKKQGICDINGTELIPPQDKYFFGYKPTPQAFYNKEGDAFIVTSKIIGGKEGIIDIWGNFIVPFGEYKYIRFNDNAHAPQCKPYFSGKKGKKHPNIQLSLKGSKLPRYGEPSRSKEENIKLLEVEQNLGNGIFISNGKYCLRNKSEENVNKRQYDEISYSQHDSAYIVRINDIYTLMDNEGNENPLITYLMFEKAYKLPDSLWQQQKLLYESIIYSDPFNKDSLNSIVYNNLGAIWEEHPESNLSGYLAWRTAQEYYESSVRIDKNNEIAIQNVARIKEQRKNAYEQRKTERKAQLATALAGLGNSLSEFNQSVTAIRNRKQENSTIETSKTVARDISKNRTATVNKNSTSNVQNERIDRRTYDNYVDQLSRMKTGLDQYNDSNRRNIQSKMRLLRTKYNFPKNELEDWNGSI